MAAAAPAAASAEGEVIGVHSIDSWNELFQKGKDAKQLVIVDFIASGCGACRSIAPIFVQISNRFPNVLCLKVDVNEMAEIAKQWHVQGTPTFLFFKEGVLVDKFVGVSEAKLQARITKHVV